MRISAMTPVLAMVALLAVPAQAGQADYNFKVFGGVAYVAPLSDSSIEGVGDAVEAASEVGWEIGGEWKPFNRFGFELSYLNATHDVEADGVTFAEVKLRPWNFTVNWHIINGEHLNWYIGPTVSYVDWGNIESPTTDPVPTDSDTAFGISTGLDIGFNQTFAIVAGVRWLNTSVESTDSSVKVDVDPLFARLGVAFRF